MAQTYRQAKDMELNGTSLVDYIYVDYATLVEVLGEPEHLGYGDKARVEWNLMLSNSVGTDVPCHIYDWKEICPIERVNEWHVGSKGMWARTVIYKLNAIISDHFGTEKW